MNYTQAKLIWFLQILVRAFPGKMYGRVGHHIFFSMGYRGGCKYNFVANENKNYGWWGYTVKKVSFVLNPSHPLKK